MNAFRQLLKAAGSHPPVGTWIMSASPIVAEAVGHAGFDWGVVDMEHAPLDIMGLVHMLQALSATKMVPVVRVPGNDAVTVKRVLDAGATTLLFPFVESRDGARAAVAATRPAARGSRGGSERRLRPDRPFLTTMSTGSGVRCSAWWRDAVRTRRLVAVAERSTGALLRRRTTGMRWVTSSEIGPPSSTVR